MSELTVKIGIMNQCVSSEQDIAKRINSIAGDIDNIRRGLSFNIRSRARINEQLVTLNKFCQTNASHVKNLHKVLSDAVVTYSNAEKNVCNNVNGISSTAAAWAGTVGDAVTGTVEKSENTEKHWWDKLFDINLKDVGKIIGNFGTVGKFGQMLLSAISGDGIGTVKNAFSLVGTAAKAGWSDMFNLKMGEWKNLKETLGEYSLKTGSKTAAVAKWAGTALTFAGSFVDNYNEYGGDLSNGNIYLETVLETAVSTGLQFAVGAGVTAVAGPVVGKWASVICGVVDSKLGISDKVSKGIIKAGKAIGDGFKQAKKSVASWFKW